MALIKTSIGVQQIMRYTPIAYFVYPTLTIHLQNVLPTKGTALKSVMAWRIPTDLKWPRLERFQTIEVTISPPTQFDDLNYLTCTARDTMESDARRFDLVFHLADGIRKGAEDEADKGCLDRVDRSVMQPDIHRLPDLRSIWGAEGWEKRAVVAKKGGYHLFYTLAKGGSLAPNQRIGWEAQGWGAPPVEGDMFLLKVSQAVDDQGCHFYEDANSSLKEMEEQKHFKCLDQLLYFGSPRLQSDD